MKILILANSASGLYQFRAELLRQLVTNNEVYFSLPNGDFIEELESIGCKFIDTEFNRRGMNPISDFKLFIKYIKILKKIKPGVVLTYTIKPNVYGGLACRLLKIPYLANITGLGTALENGGILSALTKILYKVGLKKAKCVFFQNSTNKKLFEDKKIVRGKTKLLPGSGVNLEIHRLEDYPDISNEIRFLFIGRIMKDKGIDELLSAFETVHNEYDNIRLNIIGSYDEDYSKKIEELSAKGYVFYYGSQPSVHEYIRNSHCTVLPSYHEGMANVLLESASTGRPVIATNVPGCLETFEEGITGFGCEVKDAGSLADAIIKFIELPYEQKKQMGLNGRKKVEKEFNRDIVVQAYMDELAQIETKIK